MAQPGIFGRFSETTVSFVTELGGSGTGAPSLVADPNIYNLSIDVPSLVGDTFTLTGDFFILSGSGFEELDPTQLTFSSLIDPAPVIGDDVSLTDNGDGTFSITYDISFLQEQVADDGQFLDIITITDTANQTDDVDDLAFVNFTCFAPGTGIATPTGDIAIEDLSVGDLVLTADGRAVPVRWIGRQTVSTRFGPAERLLPVRIAAGALGKNSPKRDLIVTADHAMVVGDFLVNAAALVGGAQIDFVSLSELGQRFTVYHLETDAHEVILAEGAESESFLDNAGRRAFDNFNDYERLYGSERVIPELPMPRISAARLLPQALKKRLGIVPSAAQKRCA